MGPFDVHRETHNATQLLRHYEVPTLLAAVAISRSLFGGVAVAVAARDARGGRHGGEEAGYGKQQYVSFSCALRSPCNAHSRVLTVSPDAEAATPSPTPTPTPSAPAATPSPTPTDDNTSNSNSNSATGSPTRASSSGTRRVTSAATHKTSYDGRLPAGGISLLTPAATQAAFFKIGDYVTFAWNYTSLYATPTAINIMATCTANAQLYTIAANQTVNNATGAVTWDTGGYQATAVQNPLLTETYSLIIYDVDSGLNAAAQPGYLASFGSYSFGMYVPQPYTPLNEFQCATCIASAALGDLERRALGMVLGMGLLTVLSFTWFVGGTGVIW